MGQTVYISANQISTEFINIKIHPMSGLEICAVKFERSLYDAILISEKYRK